MRRKRFGPDGCGKQDASHLIVGRKVFVRFTLTPLPSVGRSCWNLRAVHAALVLLLAMAGRLPAADREALPAVDDRWRYFQSPNFELYSRNDDAGSRELLHNLEL